MAASVNWGSFLRLRGLNPLLESILGLLGPWVFGNSHMRYRPDPAYSGVRLESDSPSHKISATTPSGF